MKLLSNRTKDGLLVYNNFEKVLKYIELFVFVCLFTLTNLSFFFVDVFQQDPDTFLIIFSVFLLLIPGFLALSVLGKFWLTIFSSLKNKNNLLNIDLKVMKKMFIYLLIFLILITLPTVFIIFWLKDINQGIIVLKITFSFYIFLCPFFFKSQISIYKEKREFRRKREKLKQANMTLEKLRKELKNKSVDEVLFDNKNSKDYSIFYKTLTKEFQDNEYIELENETKKMKNTYSSFFSIVENKLQKKKETENHLKNGKLTLGSFNKKQKNYSLEEKREILEKIKKLS